MKLKSVLAALAAVATVSAVSVCGFAATESGEMTPAPETALAGENPDTGVEGVTAFAGAMALSGAAIVISRKRD